MLQARSNPSYGFGLFRKFWKAWFASEFGRDQNFWFFQLRPFEGILKFGFWGWTWIFKSVLDVCQVWSRQKFIITFIYPRNGTKTRPDISYPTTSLCSHKTYLFWHFLYFSVLWHVNLFFLVRFHWSVTLKMVFEGT